MQHQLTRGGKRAQTSRPKFTESLGVFLCVPTCRLRWRATNSLGHQFSRCRQDSKPREARSRFGCPRKKITPSSKLANPGHEGKNAPNTVLKKKKCWETVPTTVLRMPMGTPALWGSVPVVEVGLVLARVAEVVRRARFLLAPKGQKRGCARGVRSVSRKRKFEGAASIAVTDTPAGSKATTGFHPDSTRAYASQTAKAKSAIIEQQQQDEAGADVLSLGRRQAALARIAGRSKCKRTTPTPVTRVEVNTRKTNLRRNCHPCGDVARVATDKQKNDPCVCSQGGWGNFSLRFTNTCASTTK